MSGSPPQPEFDATDDESSNPASAPELDLETQADQRESAESERTPSETTVGRRRRRRSRSQPSRGERLTATFSGVWQGAVMALLLGLPVYLAWDYGGVLPWSQWLASCVVLATGVLAAPLVIARSGSGGRSRLLIPLLALIVWTVAWLQTMPLGGQLVSRISPGSAAAYRDWIPASVPAELKQMPADVRAILAGEFPLSVAAHFTRAALSGPALFGAVCLLAAVVFRSRASIIALLAVVAISGAAIAFLGISDQIRAPAPGGNAALITPDAVATSPFGSFVCRNNAAAYLNLTLAAAIGLMVYCFRIAHDRAHGDGAYLLEPESWWDRPVFFFQNLLLQIDTATIAALILVVLNIAGVLSSQSRGGTLAVIAGTLVTTLLAGNRQMRWWRPIAILVSVSGVMMLLGSIGLIGRIGARLESLWTGGAARDGRLDHWPDGLAAAWHYFPGGAGLGAYRFAYLPYQQSSSGAWFVNADNMVVEWLVEGGIWLLPLVLVAVGFFASSLVRLARIRNAPHLTALVTCGWFVVGSQLVSQFFDFGILLPSNYLTLAVLVGGVLGALSRKYGKGKREAYPSPAGAESGFGVALPLTFALTMLTVLSTFRVAHQNAGDDFLVRQIFRSSKSLPLESAVSEQALSSSTNPTLHTALATFQISSQAERGARSLRRLDPEQTVDHRRLATLDARRAAYYQQSPADDRSPEVALLPDQSLAAIEAARQHALAALALCPLSDAARFHLLQTDFISVEGRQLSELLLQQWSVLRCRSGRSLERAARLAAVYPGAAAAKPLIYQTLLLTPERLPRVWPMIELLANSVSISELLPDDPVLLLRVLERYSLEPATREQLVQRARNRLAQEPSEGDEREQLDDAQRHFLLGRLELMELNPEQAEAAFAKAVAADPSTTEYRFQLAESLARSGKLEEAVSQIKLCLLQDPDNPRYRAQRDAWTAEPGAELQSSRDRIQRRGRSGRGG